MHRAPTFTLINLEPTIAPVSLLDRLSTFISSVLSPVKTHSYVDQVNLKNYVFELTETDDRAQMTAYGKGIKQRDFIRLSQGLYLVEAIEYYADPSDLWTAVLVRVSD